MITQGTGLHNNMMGNTGGGGPQQQQIRGFSPSKPKWKQTQSGVMQYPIGQHRKIKY